MNRRDAMRAVASSLSAWVGASLAQRLNKIPVIGVPLITAGPNDTLMLAFRRGLRERGYVDGENIRIEHRSAEGKVERLVQLALDLVALKVDVFVAGMVLIAQAVRKATSTTPIIVVAWDDDPAAAGLIQSLSRPGGNITGIYTRVTETHGKRLELLKECRPGLSRVAAVHDAFGKRQLRDLESAAASLRLQLQPVEVSPPYDYQAAFASAKRSRADAATIVISPRFYVDRQQVVDAALAQRLPTMFQDYASVRTGGLMSYGPDLDETWVRTGYFVDRLLKGAKPGDLPMEQPKVYRLLVNLKTAKELRLTIPESILLRADEVIR